VPGVRGALVSLTRPSDALLREGQGETRQAGEALEAERRAHDQTRAEVREAKAIGDVRQIGNLVGDHRRTAEQYSAVSLGQVYANIAYYLAHTAEVNDYLRARERLERLWH
jgi:hypothetical protein